MNNVKLEDAKILRVKKSEDSSSSSSSSSSSPSCSSGNCNSPKPKKNVKEVTLKKAKKKSEQGKTKPGQGQGKPKPGQRQGQPKPGQGQGQPGQAQGKGQGQGQAKPGQGQGQGQGKPGQEQGQSGQIKKGGQPNFRDNPEEMTDIPKIGEETPGQKVIRDPNASLGKKIKTKAKETKDIGKKFTKKKVKTDWDNLKKQTMSRHSSVLSDRAKALLSKIKGTEPTVNWKKELKKFFDLSLKKEKWVLPNKRLLAGGTVVYGRKKIGEDTLKTIVAMVDTSGSISNEQAKVFVNEIMYLCKTYNADKTIIIYCSDDIDGIDIIKKGGKPDFTKMGSTGGNAKGFIPPFDWLHKEKITPSLVVYLTDTGGAMPDPTKYGIPKIEKKTIWFICSPTIYTKPTFGKILFAPVSAIRT